MENHGAGLQKVREQIREAFEVVHDDLATKIFLDVTDDVVIEDEDVDLTREVDAVLRDRVLHVEQSIPQDVRQSE